MTARVLVVDDVLSNIKLLEARLTAEYFDVLTAMNGAEALDICAQGLCDIVLLDVMMPGMDGFEVCRRLKASSLTSHIPVVMVTALDQTSDRVRGLEAGADDLLTKPIDEMAVIARVRSLARLKVAIDELRARAVTSAALGLTDAATELLSDTGVKAKILIADDRANSTERVVSALSRSYEITVEAKPQEALFKAAEGGFDLIIVSLSLQNFDGLRLCSQLRSLERTRNVPILIIAETEDRQRVLRGLDLGVNDYLMRPVDRNELIARVRTQVRRKRYVDHLKDNLQASIEMAVVDALTGLNNRRFLESHFASLLDEAVHKDKPLSLMILDIDHFKLVNDNYGHDAGDEVLKAFGARIKRVVRVADLICRMGGEEFVVVMPNTSIDLAEVIAERIRSSIQGARFQIDASGRSIPVTVSIGLADRRNDVTPDVVYKRADKALYRAKTEGRNRISADAA